MSQIQITYKKTDDLIPYARNSRVHSEMQINQIASSIREFGFRNPVLVDGENGIIAGHGRVLAAMKLGLDTIPTIECKDLTDTQKRAYIIADNKIALNATWDEEMLMLEIEDFRQLGIDTDILGFDESELKKTNIDYSVLDDANLDNQLNDMANGVKKAIQIEFEPQHYEEAQELVKYWREQGAYVGYMLLTYLKEQKDQNV